MSERSNYRWIIAPACEHLEPRLLLNAAFAAPTLLSVSPVGNTHTAAARERITAEYDQRLDPTSVTDQTFVVNAMQTGRLLAPPNVLGAADRTIMFKPATAYHPGELVEVPPTGGLPTRGGEKAAPYVWQFRRSVADGSGMFRGTVQSLGNGRSNAAALGDVDGDGDLDAFVANGFGEANKVWRNDGAGVFSDSGQALGAGDSHAVALGDLDGDGDLDAFVSGDADKVWVNNGSGVFSDSGQTLGSGTTAVSLGDLDGDGDLDAFVVDWDSSERIWLNDGTGKFTAGQSLNTLSTWDVALGDVDGDGDLDAFVAQGFNHGNTVWRNNGSGVFANTGQVLGNSYSYAVELGDVDGDGDLDAFVANGTAGGQGNKVWRNNGSGVFADSGQSLGSFETVAVALGDVDGDGDLDAFAGNRVGQGNRVWVNNGAGSFSLTAQTPGVANTHDVELGDLDGDGDLDAFVANFGAPGEPNGVLLNLDTVSVVSVAPDPNSHDATAGADVSVTYDHDVYPNTVTDDTFVVHAMQTGHLTAPPAVLSVIGPTVTLNPARPFHPGELVQATATSEILSRHGLGAGLGTERGYVWQFRAEVSGGTGNFVDTGQRLGNSYGRAGELGDLDGDNDLDAFVVNWSQGNTVWRNNGAGAFTNTGQNLGVAISYDVALGDVDGDGDLDAFVANAFSQPNKVWLNNGSGTFSDSGQSLGNSISYGVELGDVDGDGDLDAFVANVGPDKVWLNNGSGVFSDSGQLLGSAASEEVALADVDGDGDLDAYVCQNGPGDTVWFNDGDGVFSNSGQSLASGGSRDVAMGDVDGDGDADAFVARGAGGANTVWINNGSGVFSDSGQMLGNWPSAGVALGDLDGDGDLDAFVGNEGAPNRVWVNNGSGGFADSGQAMGATSTKSVALGDVDGDGDLDALIANYSGQGDEVWRNREAGGPRATGVLVAGREWTRAFLDHLAAERLGKNGYLIPAGSFEQLSTLPWVNINQIKIVFDRRVSIDASHLRVSGVNVQQYPIGGFTYDEDRNEATWTFEGYFEADRMLLVLADEVRDEAGRALDGEWINAVSEYPSGDGEAGGDFRFEMNVLPGDVDRSREVRSSDVIKVRRKSNTTPGHEWYSAFYDVDGDAQIRSSDTIKVRRRTNTTLPNGEPALPNAWDAGASIPLGAPSLFESADIDRRELRRSDGPVVLEIVDILSAPTQVTLIEPAV